jgi:glycerophosphoryl diester phosphodiesterase
MVNIVGHRGAAGIEPENTLRSFRRAVDVGVDAIEFDVRETVDSELVVIHDRTVDRTTDGTGAVSQMTLSELRTLSAPNGAPVPTLDEVLAFAVKTDVGLYVELKVTDVAERTYKTIVRRDIVENTIIFSSLPEAVQKLDASRVCLGLSVREVTDETLETAISLDVGFVLGPGRPDTRAVRRIRNRGLKPGISTINDPQMLRRAIELEPYSVLTDHPDRA